MKKESNRIYWLVVIAGCGLIGSCLGLGVNVAGLFFNSVAADFGVGRGTVAASLTIYNLVHAFAGMLAAKVMMRCGFKKPLCLERFCRYRLPSFCRCVPMSG